MKVILKIKTGREAKEHSLKLGEMVAIGRSKEAEISVEDGKISGRHCRLYLKSDRLELFDLDSKNGTYLNGIRIDRSEVFLGDEIHIGDSFVTLEESKMPQDAIDALTFPGPFKERLNYELKADFTGARIQNQLSNKKNPLVPKIEMKSHEQEIVLRKKIKSNLKLSKQEIRLQNPFLSFTSLILDGLAFVSLLGSPILFSHKFIPKTLPPDQKLMVLGSSMALLGISFLVLNFKKTKFTVGERIAGIKELYDKQ